MVFWTKAYEQVAPQLMPANWLVTVPVPIPALVRLRMQKEGVNVWAPIVRVGCFCQIKGFRWGRRIGFCWGGCIGNR